jgi:hypothetical protein
MTLHMKNPTAGGAAGLDKTTSLPSRNDGPSNAPEIAPAQAELTRNPAAVAAAIKDLTAEYAVEAARIASIYAVHFVEDMGIGDVWSAEHDMRGAVLHLKEAAAQFREWQGKPLEFYDFVEKLCPAPRYAYLFSRYRHNEKWDCHGDEAPAICEAAQ